ncbi:MAG: CapA family protein [Blastochloris sp.]|nr:CapA family protein [Blastochloris sp.]
MVASSPAAARPIDPFEALPPSAVADEPVVTLVAVGDLMLGRSIGATLERDPSESPFAGVAEQLRAADVTVGNLECALGTGGTAARKGYTFLGPPAAAESLADAGFDVLSLANNHSLDYGVEALTQTTTLLDNVDILHPGAGLDEQTAHAPALLTVKGMRLAFLAYVDVPVEWRGFDTASWRATVQQPGLAWADPKLIARDVGAAKAQADAVIVLLHSGYEGKHAPNDIQRKAARTAIDAGATLVLGAHPHVLQPVERYKDGLIAYSLGNFVFDGFTGAGAQSAILTVTLTPSGVRDLQWTPVVLREGRPQPAKGSEATAILKQVQWRSVGVRR